MTFEPEPPAGTDIEAISLIKILASFTDFDKQFHMTAVTLADRAIARLLQSSAEIPRPETFCDGLTTLFKDLRPEQAFVDQVGAKFRYSLDKFVLKYIASLHAKPKKRVRFSDDIAQQQPDGETDE